jgi:hypothetical protein
MLRRVWYAVDVANVASPNSAIDEATGHLPNGNETAASACVAVLAPGRPVSTRSRSFWTASSGKPPVTGEADPPSRAEPHDGGTPATQVLQLPMMARVTAEPAR